MKKLYYIISTLGFLALFLSACICDAGYPAISFIPQGIIGTAMLVGGIYGVRRKEQAEKAREYSLKRKSIKVLRSEVTRKNDL